MASETLAVPEDHLREVIEILRRGMAAGPVSAEVREALERWCAEEEAYLDDDAPESG